MGTRTMTRGHRDFGDGSGSSRGFKEYLRMLKDQQLQGDAGPNMATLGYIGVIESNECFVQQGQPKANRSSYKARLEGGSGPSPSECKASQKSSGQKRQAITGYLP